VRDRAEIEADVTNWQRMFSSAVVRAQKAEAALDEANAEIERLQERIDGQAWEDLQAENQRLRERLDRLRAVMNVGSE
jgi:peptidoglycan hydrolase CwlO-like protein